MKFSIVIPVHNGSATLTATLESVARLEGADREVIVVDDASTDGTAELARGHGARVIVLEENAGPATARTRGAEAATGEVVLFTDDDVWVPTEMLTRIQDCMQRTGAEAVQGIFSRDSPHPNLVSQYKNLYNRLVLLRLPDFIDTTFTSVTAVRRDVFFHCGGFDTLIRRASVEDRTLGRNLVRGGHRIALDRGLEVVHNKRLGLVGLLRNQFRRSRDLARLLLRNRSEPPIPEGVPPQTPTDDGGKARFGTNAVSTMARLPAAYACLTFLALGSSLGSPFWVASCLAGLLSLLLFLFFAGPITRGLALERGWVFALATLHINFLDALASGAGVAWGLFSFLALGRRY